MVSVNLILNNSSANFKVTWMKLHNDEGRKELGFT